MEVGFLQLFLLLPRRLFFASLINWLGGYAIVALLAVAVAFVVRSHVFHKRKSKSKDSVEEIDEEDASIISKGEIFEQLTHAVSVVTTKIPKVYAKIVNGLAFEERSTLKESLKKG